VKVGQAIEITRLELSVSALRQEATRCDDGRVACRILAIAHVLDGLSRTDAARACGMDRQTLRDWVHRYNAEGIAGLADAPRTGRPPVLTGEQMTELKRLVLIGPDPACDGVVRWRCIDLREQIAERFAVEVRERTVGKLLRRMGFSRVQPRPHNPQRDLDAQETFKKTSPRW
jgi:transposase